MGARPARSHMAGAMVTQTVGWGLCAVPHAWAEEGSRARRSVMGGPWVRPGR
jgi:hypothetical protein